jgi:hypothetical protein
MAVYVFDGEALNIALPVSTELNTTDLYSRWKDYVKTSSTNAGFAPTFDSTGGDDIDPLAGTTIPHYVKIKNGWAISPDELDYTLAVTTGILLRLGGGDPFLDTVGAFTVRINYQQPVQAITVGLDPETVIIEGAVTEAELMRHLLAYIAGKTEIEILAGGLANVKFKSQDDTKDRITAALDGSERTSVTLDGSE